MLAISSTTKNKSFCIFPLCFCTWYEFPACHGSCLVGFILDKGKATILHPVHCTGIHNHIHHPFSHLDLELQ